MLKKSEETHKESQIRNTNRYRNTRKSFFSLSQKIGILITLVVFVALLPSSLFTTQRVAQVIYDRVAINAVSINNILCHSDEIIDGLNPINGINDPDGRVCKEVDNLTKLV